MADGSLPIRVPVGHLPPQAGEEADVVLFAGAGGSSIAVERALGKHPDAALNHWPLALGVHQANYPDAEHHCADVMETDPRHVCAGRPVRLLWLSPDCRHFSAAKGSAPVSPTIRALAWAAIPWAVLRRPRVIVLENVKGFLSWGPTITLACGKVVPDPEHKGRTFARWVRRLRQLGYVVEWRILSAADFGAPTIRERLFLVARCDGGPMALSDLQPTHAPRAKAGAAGLPAHRAAAEIIDWSRPCPSIFLSPEEARALRVKRPLEEATLARIAKGLLRYTIGCADPFIVPVTHTGERRSLDVRAPLGTVTGANRGEFALVAPLLTGCGGRMAETHPRDAREPYATITSKNDSALIAASMVRTDMTGARFAGANDVQDPLRTVTSAGGLALASAVLVPRYGEREGQEPRARAVTEPLATVVGTSNQGALATAYLARDFGGSVGADLSDPAPVITAGGGGHAGVVAAFMEQANTDMVGHDARTPVSTIVGRGTTQRLVTAQLTHLRGSGGGSGDPRDPTHSPTAGGQHAAVLEALLRGDVQMDTPFARERELRAFLVKYYGEATAQDVADPLGTVTSRARFGLVVVAGRAFRIVDIGMRMLDPKTELAAAMGVPPDYVLDRDADGRPVTKTNITKMVGNMVCPDPAEAILRGLFPEAAVLPDRRRAA